MARRRTLRPDEQEIWAAVARTATPLHPGRQLFLREVESPRNAVPVHPDAPEPHGHTHMRVPLFQLGEKARTKPKVDLVPSPAEALAAAPLQMDAKTHGKMTRGKLAPEARIDLHGMTLPAAHPELIRFVLNAQSDGLWLVLVITGKGKKGQDIGPIPQRMGVLRHQVPHWLRLPPLGQAVLQVSEAHLKHGGSGAYYVYLRRR
jgi:DNA-nicking Smr family endonuclease